MQTLKSEDLPEISTQRSRGIGLVRGKNGHSMPFLRSSNTKRAFYVSGEFHEGDSLFRISTHRRFQEEKREETNMSETTNKGNGKKIAIAVAIVAVIAAIFGAIYMQFSPKASAGAKEITVEVVDDKAESKLYNVNTDAEYLRQVLEETEGLTVEGTESEYGLMVETVNGLTADFNTNGAYWAFYVDGDYCNYGVDEQPVEDGQAYKIVYTTE